jgi:hypothetical protein
LNSYGGNTEPPGLGLGTATTVGSYEYQQSTGQGYVGLCATNEYKATVTTGLPYYTWCASRIRAGCGESTISGPQADAACTTNTAPLKFTPKSTCCRVQCTINSKYDAYAIGDVDTQTGALGARVVFAANTAQYGQSIAPGYLTISTTSYLNTENGVQLMIVEPVDWSAGGSGYQAKIN